MTVSERARAVEAQFRDLPRADGFDLQRERDNTRDAHVLTGVPKDTLCEWETVAGTRCLRVRPVSPRSDLEAIFLHGGAFCLMSAMTHHRLAGHIATAIQADVLLPDYPLAPEHPYPAARDACLSVIAQRRRQGPVRQVLIGDSAGGGLALSALCALRDDGSQLPDALVLMSPWLDLSLSGPQARAGCIDDPMLTLGSLEACAALYVDGLPMTDPGVSPLWATFEDLPPLLLQSAGKDLLREDAERLADLWPSDGDLEVQAFDHMMHSFQMFAGDLPEADDALSKVAHFLAHRAI